jgi:hypothetical protein
MLRPLKKRPAWPMDTGQEDIPELFEMLRLVNQKILNLSKNSIRSKF